MPADHSPGSLPDSRPLFRLVARTRALLRSSWVVTGVGLSLGLLLATLVVVTLLDLFVPLEPIDLPWVGVLALDPIARVLALALVVVPAVLAFLHGVLRPLFRRLSPTQVARRIEQQLPGIHNRLVSAIDLETRKPAGQTSPVFLRRLLNEALDRVRGFRPWSVLDRASLRRAGLFAGMSLGCAVLVGVLFADRLPTSLARIFRPLADIPPASGVTYTVLPGTADVLRDEDITFVAEVTKGEPKELRLEMYGHKGAVQKFDLKPDRSDPSVWKVTVDAASLGDGFKDGFRYRVYGGRTWSPQFTLALVERPVLAEFRKAVHYPAYMRIKEPVPTPREATEVTGPEGGQVEVIVSAQGQVAEGEVQILEPDTRRIPPERQQERVWFEDKLPVGVTTDVSWNWQALGKKKVHLDSTTHGTHSHWFQGDPVGLALNKGDVLYAYVRLAPGQVPEEVMLEWHDGDGWEHRAYWGADKIKEGRAGTPSRYEAGELPPAGKWVRLEVPAGKVGLEGKTVRGIAFKVHEGQASWGSAGSVQVEEPGVRVVKTYAMKRGEGGTWAGKFPLVGSGLFRAELRNKQGHPNKPMKEVKFIALPDKPPYVALDRQGVELVLNKPSAVPLSITAFDDYGLDEIAVLSRPSLNIPHERRTLKQLDTPERTVNLVGSLDESAKLKPGEVVRYLIEAKDTKGQVARTPEFVVRIASDANAADKQLEAFDKAQDTFQDRLAKLIAEQKKVSDALEKAEKEYAELTEKVRERAEEAKPEAGKPEKPGPKLPEVKLTPEEAKRLAELQKELARLAAEEGKNAEAARQIGAELKRSAEQGEKMDLLPKPVAQQMQATTRLFDRMVTQAMRDLGQKLNAGADPKSVPASVPDLKDLKDRSGRIGKEMEGLKDRLDALSRARKGLREDIQKALAELREKMLREDARLSARDLEQLRDFLQRLREQMKNAQGRQADAAREAEEGGDPKKAQRRQADLEKELENLLAQARKLLDKPRKDRDRPEFPDAPYRADEKEDKVPPREEDTDEPLPSKKGKEKDRAKDKGKESGEKAKDKKTDEEEDEPKFMPRLGGPRPKIDPRFDKKRRPVKKKGEKPEGDEKDDDREDEKMRDLEAAEKSLESDANTLESMIRSLQQAAGKPQSKGKEGQPSEGQELADQLREMMRSAQMREASAMAAAMRGLQQGMQRGQPQQGMPRAASQAPQDDRGNLQGGEGSEGGMGGELAKLPADVRATILKMPPSRFRDELIQGLSERGPEAYQAFIEDYFKRLTESKKN